MTDNTLISFNKANREEANIIKNMIVQQFGKNSINFMTDYELWVKRGKIKEVFAVPTNLIEFVERLSSNIYSVGIPIGTLWGNTMQIEIEGAAVIRPHTKKIVKIKTDQFLYGKHIFKENIDEIHEEFHKNDFVIIVGQNNIHYGIAQATMDSQKLSEIPSNTIVFKGNRNKPIDRGWYLRKGN